jgi:hypothetical protein
MTSIPTPGGGPARVTVFEGAARFADGNTELRMEAGQEAQVTTSYPAAVAVSQLPPGAKSPAADPGANPDQPSPAGSEATADGSPQAAPDEFLSWAMASEYNPEQPQSAQFVSREMTGYERLDAYGRWEKRRDYGPVWFPAAVPADWAPYRFGHWASIAPWGWTWIDDQPWGFAPFHFGRWVRIDERWAWVPGSRVEQPVYAPALVAFLEDIEDADTARGGEPPVGWFPLAPGDAYTPWYNAGPEYIESVNVVYAARYRDPAWRDHAERNGEAWQSEFANRRFATLVHREALAYGRPVIHEIVHMPADHLERAVIAREAPRVVPVAARIIPGAGGLRGAAPHETAPRMTNPGFPHDGLRGNAAAAASQRVWPEHPNPSAAGARPEAHSWGRAPEPAGQHMPQQFRPPEGYHPARVVPQYGRPEDPHTPALGPQVGHPEVPHMPTPGQQAGRPEVPHMPMPGQQAGHPEVPHMPMPGQQFGRPEVPHMPASAAQGTAPQFGHPEAFHTPAPTYHAAAQQFGRPEVPPAAAAPRPGAPQVARPGAPAVIGHAAPGIASGMPQVAARPAVAAKPVTAGSAPQGKKK